MTGSQKKKQEEEKKIVKKVHEATLVTLHSPGHYPDVSGVMFSVKATNNILFFAHIFTHTHKLWLHILFSSNSILYVHPRPCQCQSLHYKWVYVICCNEAFLKMFSSFYPTAHRVISSVMQTPALIMSLAYDSASE